YCISLVFSVFFFSSRRRHTRSKRDWSSDVCSSDLEFKQAIKRRALGKRRWHPMGQHMAHGFIREKLKSSKINILLKCMQHLHNVIKGIDTEHKCCEVFRLAC